LIASSPAFVVAVVYNGHDLLGLGSGQYIWTAQLCACWSPASQAGWQSPQLRRATPEYLTWQTGSRKYACSGVGESPNRRL
jgi:hypothetical protein